MNRRDLFKGLAAGGIVVAGELWMPGAKTIFLPPKRRLVSATALITVERWNDEYFRQVIQDNLLMLKPLANNTARAEQEVE